MNINLEIRWLKSEVNELFETAFEYYVGWNSHKASPVNQKSTSSIEKSAKF